MRRTLVVGAAPAAGGEDFYRVLLAGADAVVAADAAGEWCVALGRVPDIAVGDFDSALAGAQERLASAGAELIAFGSDKDATDLELAVGVALERFGPPLVLTAAFTERLDHSLAAVGTLLRAGAGASAREPGWTMWACAPGAPLCLSCPSGTLVSVLAPGGAEGVSISGTRWTLDGARLESLSGHGMSNLAIGGDVRVSTTDGVLAVFVGSGSL